jgi:DNA topoisomerase-1
MRPLANAQPVWLANGRAATRGQCPECGTALTRIGTTPGHADLPKPDPVDRPAPKKAIKPTGPAPSEVSAPLTHDIQAYCVKCKAMRPLAEGRAIFMANARPAAEGRCGECGTRLFKIGATSDHAGLPQPVAEVKAKVKVEAKGEAKATKTKVEAKVKVEPKVERKAGGGKAAGKSFARAIHPGAKLVIVESPAKARTVGRFLGSGYEVRASVGHVRDLLRSQLSVDVEHDFAPKYRVPDDKKEVVKTLKAAAAEASEVYLATDPDREGEAIAWHLQEAIGIPAGSARRVVFHEITRPAIAEAFSHSRDVDMRLVDAQQARRILDRLVGYQVSPLLWERVRGRLSAGRVQSVALRLIVEREREILAFSPVEYWSLDAELAQQTARDQKKRPSFVARLVRIRGQEADLKNREDSAVVVADLAGAVYVVASVKRGERKRRPQPPFTTSTLQQDAGQKLGMTAARTMRVAQDLYEGIDVGEGGAVGLITYMRTDSVNVAQEAQAEARALITEQFGPDYIPGEPNVYRARAKNAQEAHEAVRPTSVRRTPAALAGKLSPEQQRLYEIIWQRFVASQMAAAVYDTLTVDVEAGQPAVRDRPYLFRVSGSSVRFPGFLAVYSGGASGPAENSGNGERDGARDEDRRAAGEKENGGVEALLPTISATLPLLVPAEPLDLLRLLPEQHFTQPPPRFTEATLVKMLEENGIGRPSTYAAIISTILERGYVGRSEKKLVPTDLGYTVNDLLVKHFDTIFNVGFTASMEEHLDTISRGEEEIAPVLRNFYTFFEPQLREAERTMEKVVVEPEKIGEPCPECGADLVIKLGRFGKFIGCAGYPACRFTRPLVAKIDVKCPKDGGDIAERRTRNGRVFYGCVNYPACDFTSWKRPLPQPCPHCGRLLVLAGKEWAECTACGKRTKVEMLSV